MAPERATGERGRRPRLGRFRRPVWRDGAFWAAVALTAVAFAIQVALVSDRSGWLTWAALALRLVLTWIVISSLMRIRIGMERGLVAGFTEAEERRRAAPGPSAMEGAARAGGRIAGKAVRAYRRPDDQPR
jgi:hypothetical protein